MKRPIFIMLALLIIAFAGPMLIKKPNGTPFMEFPFVEGSLESIRDSSNSSSNQSFYKWQDDDGTWHYSDNPPEGKVIETITVNTNTNLIQGLRIEKNEIISTTNDVDVKKDVEIEETSGIPLPMTVPIEKVTEMLDDANNIQNLLDGRSKKIEQATQGH